jgi:4-hydroxyacetophenone monooxygenase
MLVLATGFHAHRPLGPMRVYGRGGRSLNELWGEDDPRAYLGINVPGFPNYFIMYGPNTNLAHGGSAIFHTECQVRYTLRCLRELIEGGFAAMECRQEAHDAYNAKVDAIHEKMVWAHPGVGNWYKNSKGRVVMTTPWRMVDYWRMTAELDPADYIWREREPSRPTAAIAG